MILLSKIPLVALILLSLNCSAQRPTPENLGFRHVQTTYRKDIVDILIKSKKGEDFVQKPLLLFIQGSLPRPLIIIYDTTRTFQIFPFKLDSLLEKYHVAIIGKPFIPFIADERALSKDYNFINPDTKEFPPEYVARNYLNYYVARNKAVIKFLQKQKWVSKDKLVVAGHSEGSTIAAKLAFDFRAVTHLIYLSGNPFGRIMSIIERNRREETDSTPLADDSFNYWESVVESPEQMIGPGDTNKATYQFSEPPFKFLQKLSIPVLIAYGTNDYSSTYNDFLRVDMIRQKKINFTFNAYIGLDHNFFPKDKDDKPDYEIYNWDKIGYDIGAWLGRH